MKELRKHLETSLKNDQLKYKPAAQAAGRTLPDATPPLGKINPFSKIALTFESIQLFRCPSRFRISEKMSI